MGPNDDDRVLLDQVMGGRVEYPRMDEAYDIVGINLELFQFTMITLWLQQFTALTIFIAWKWYTFIH